ncbi:MAG: single-stranded DNA-binding protein [Flavobacteriales bacterium]|jgi:single-strand DNA-binding protein|nr:single-stranded DNA-binding protein [Flavobacteriales bacterium]
MARSLNKVMLIGNLGRDPEVRHLENGTAVANFSIATSESYRDRNTGETITNTDWHNVVLWRGLADVAEKYLKKGDKVYLEGKLRSRSYQDQQGVTKYITEVVVDDMVMLGNRNSGEMGGGQMPQQSSPSPKAPDLKLEEEDDDLPF